MFPENFEEYHVSTRYLQLESAPRTVRDAVAKTKRRKPTRVGNRNNFDLLSKEPGMLFRQF
jgi:hypothetical protein